MPPQDAQQIENAAHTMMCGALAIPFVMVAAIVAAFFLVSLPIFGLMAIGLRALIRSALK